jgi:hypothetical protein
MDSKYTNTNKNYWHKYFNDKIIGMDIVSAVNLLHEHKFSYFYRNHNNEKVFSFDPSEIGKKFESMCTIDTVTNNNVTVISYIKVPPESTVFRKFPI